MKRGVKYAPPTGGGANHCVVVSTTATTDSATSTAEADKSVGISAEVVKAQRRQFKDRGKICKSKGGKVGRQERGAWCDKVEGKAGG